MQNITLPARCTWWAQPAAPDGAQRAQQAAPLRGWWAAPLRGWWAAPLRGWWAAPLRGWWAAPLRGWWAAPLRGWWGAAGCAPTLFFMGRLSPLRHAHQPRRLFCALACVGH